MIFGKFVDAEGILASQLRFLSRAVSDDETRYFMQEIHIEPSDKGEGLLLGIATDGRHLHLVDPLSKAATEVYGMTPGYWRSLRTFKNSERIWVAQLGEKETAGWVYPNWRKVVPDGKAVQHRTTFNGISLETGEGSIEIATFFHDFPDATALNFRFLEALGIDAEWDVEWSGPQKSIKFIDGDRMAVIMPSIIS